MKKLVYTRVLALILLVILLVFGAMPASASATHTQYDSVRLQDDFYTAVNADWLSSTVLSPGQASISGFCELAQTVYATLLDDFSTMCPNETPGALGQFLAYWRMASDLEIRNAQGALPLRPVIERILDLDNLAQLDARLDQWVLDSLPLPFGLSVAPDMGNASYQALYAGAPSLILPDVSYYHDPFGQTLLEVFAETGITLLEFAGVPNADSVMQNALVFDRLLVPYVQTALERSAYASQYHPVDMDVFTQFGGGLDFEQLLSRLVGQRPERVIVTDPAFFEALSDILIEAHFEKLRDWMLVRAVFDFAGFLDEAFLHTAMHYSNAITGQTTRRDPAQLAFLLATEIYGGVVGDYYGRTYFGESAREEVSGLADALVEVFRVRLLDNNWLSPETITAALEKLEALTIHIGYPDVFDPIYDRFTVTAVADGGTLLSNTMAFARMAREENFARFGTAVDRTAWTMPAHMVNAQYNPLANAMTFPAAILQAPFYSADQSMSENLGGIGTVIAHEITHAFDLNGAQFGADGSLSNWWTEADHAAFSEKTDAMIALFDGASHNGSAVCGYLTVSENIADAAGLGAAFDVLQGLPAGDAEAFFYNWARIWRNVCTPQYAALLQRMDVHAPGALRANVQLGNLDAFYDTFVIEAEDGMYIEPERRVVIW